VGEQRHRRRCRSAVEPNVVLPKHGCDLEPGLGDEPAVTLATRGQFGASLKAVEVSPTGLRLPLAAAGSFHQLPADDAHDDEQDRGRRVVGSGDGERPVRLGEEEVEGEAGDHREEHGDATAAEHRGAQHREHQHDRQVRAGDVLPNGDERGDQHHRSRKGQDPSRPTRARDAGHRRGPSNHTGTARRGRPLSGVSHELVGERRARRR
jgi:hypothetical protein